MDRVPYWRFRGHTLGYWIDFNIEVRFQLEEIQGFRDIKEIRSFSWSWPERSEEKLANCDSEELHLLYRRIVGLDFLRFLPHFSHQVRPSAPDHSDFGDAGSDNKHKYKYKCKCKEKEKDTFLAPGEPITFGLILHLI